MENSKDMEFKRRQIENKRRNLQYNSRFMLIFMGTFIGSVFGFSTFRFIQNISHIEEYQLPLAFWISHLFLPTAIIIACIIFLLICLFQIRKKLKKLGNVILE